MTQSSLRFALLPALLAVLACAAPVAPADEKAVDKKQTEPTAPSDSVTLIKGRIRFTPPSGWLAAKNVARDDRAAYVPASRDGVALIEVWPADGSLSAKAAKAICKKINEMRTKEGATVLKEATIERDKRFDLRIHERYRQNDKTSDQLRLYRTVAGRIVVVTVNTASPDPDVVKAIHGAAEEMLLSAKSTKARRAQATTKPAKPKSKAKKSTKTK